MTLAGAARTRAGSPGKRWVAQGGFGPVSVGDPLRRRG